MTGIGPIDYDLLRGSSRNAALAKFLNGAFLHCKLQLLDRKQADKRLCRRVNGELITLPSAHALRVMMHDFRNFGLGHSHFRSEESQLAPVDASLVRHDDLCNRLMQSADIRNDAYLVTLIIKARHHP